MYKLKIKSGILNHKKIGRKSISDLQQTDLKTLYDEGWQYVEKVESTSKESTKEQKSPSK